MKRIKTSLLLIVIVQFYAMQALSQERPNILWLTYEDTSPEFIGCYGNEKAKTPNMDKLAKEGVRFSAAYSTASVCSPSRFCLITGIPADDAGTGNHRSYYRVSPEVKGFPYYLRQAGYYTSNNFKTDYNLYGASSFISESWDESSKKAGWWNREDGQPFFAVYNSPSSHQSRTMTNTYKSYEELVLNELAEDEITDKDSIVLPPFLSNSPEMRKEFSRVYNSITLADKEFGQWLQRLEDDGLLDETIIFCFSDHGQGITRSKGTSSVTGSRVPFIVWMPEKYSELSPWGAGIITEEVVSFEDFAPTVLSLAGVEIPKYMKGNVFLGKERNNTRKYAFSGVDRVDESFELSRTVQDGTYQYTKVYRPYQPFIRWNLYFDVSEMQQIARRDYKKGKLNSEQSSFFSVRDSEYFYDISSDVWGMRNFIGKKEYRNEIEKLKVALRNNLLAVNDPCFMPEYVFSKNLDKTPIELAKEDYPLDRILDIADCVGMGKKALDKQLKELGSDNRYVRYWAAIGVFSQNKISKKDIDCLVSYCSEESFMPAKTVAVMSLFKFGGESYLSEVKGVLNSLEPFIIQEALNMLMTMDDYKMELVLDDLENIYSENIKVKEMGPNLQYIKMIRHKLKGESLGVVE